MIPLATTDPEFLRVAIDVALVVASAVTLFGAYRVVVGPETADQVVALDTIATDVVAIAVLFALRESTTVGTKSGHFFVDIALVLAIIGFVSTLAVAQYLTEGGIVD